MQRYLLFDSGCSVCTRLADEIECASDGWLAAHSLRDPDVKTLLDAAKPGWHWAPTLLEVQDGRPRVFTGLQMRARMALGHGERGGCCSKSTALSHSAVAHLRRRAAVFLSGQARWRACSCCRKAVQLVHHHIYQVNRASFRFAICQGQKLKLTLLLHRILPALRNSRRGYVKILVNGFCCAQIKQTSSN